MRFWPALAFATIAAIACGQTTTDTFGKTNAQILAMGRDDWYKFYTAKAGESTAAMSSAYDIYCQAARARNDALIANSSNKDKPLKLRKLLNDYCSNAVDLASNHTGGGTMWVPVEGSAAAGVEDVLYAYLSAKGPTAKHIVVSTVSKKLAALRTDIEKVHKDPEAEYFKYEDAKNSYRQMQQDFVELVKLAKRLGRADSDRVLGFCLIYATTAFG